MITVRQLGALVHRYPAADERDDLLDFVSSVRDRQAAMSELEKHERPIVESTLSMLRQMYPNFHKYHQHGWEKGYRDLALMLTYIGRATYLNDQKLLDDQVLIWVRTIFKSLNFTPKFLRDGFTLLRVSTRKFVTPRSYELLEPVMNHVIEFLSDIPEPIKPEV